MSRRYDLDGVAILITAFSFFLAVVTLASAKPKEPKPGEARLTVSRPGTMSSPGRPAIVRLSVEIKYPTPDFFCPSVELTIWGEPLCDAEQLATDRFCGPSVRDVPTYHEKQESDCDPWRETEEIVVSPPPPQGDGGHYTPASRDQAFVWPYGGAKRLGMGAGEWEFEVTLVQGAKRYILKDRVTVH